MYSFTSDIAQCLPSEWSCVTLLKNYNLEIMSQHSSQYQILKNEVSGLFNQGITKIVRIENPFLFTRFMLKRAEYESRGYVNIMKLYHDTAACNIDSIASTNLDWRRAKRVKFGKGVSFSPSPSYANKESSRLNGTNRAMIVADVLVGHGEHVITSRTLPLDGYDTTIGNSYNVYVKYYDDEFYPKYAVYYLNR